jgi:hypothetical protein
VLNYAQRSVPNRAFRLALGWVLALQAAWLASTFYMNCGAASAGDGVTPCEPKVFAALGRILQGFNEAGAQPAAMFIPPFDLSRIPHAPGWFVEWGWTLTLTVVNGLLWTLGLAAVVAGMIGVRTLFVLLAAQPSTRNRAARQRGETW